jgi:hypothetical protein
VAHGRDQRARVPTALGAYTGRHSAEVRFFAVAVADPPSLVRSFDAAGRLIGASEVRTDRGEDAGPQVVLRRGGRGAGRWRLTAHVEQTLEPRPDRPDRMVAQLCLSLAAGNGEATGCGAVAGPSLGLAPQLEAGCGAVPRLLVTPVGTAIRRVVVVLGSGRRVAVAARAAPERFGVQARFATAVLPDHEAVRRVLALDARGRVSQRVELRAAPGTVTCQGGDRGGGTSGYMSPEPDGPEARRRAVHLAASTPAGGRLLLGDRNDDLCLAVVLGAKREAYCTGPPLDPGFPDYAIARAGDRAVIAGVTTPGARRPEFVLDDGTRLRPALQEPGAYAGRYRAYVRVFAVDIPAGRRAVRAITRDPAGRVVMASPGPEEPAGADRLRSVLRYRAGGALLDLRARVQTYDSSFEGDRSRFRLLCLAPRLGGRALVEGYQGCVDGSPRRRQMIGVASCTPRGVVFYGALGPRDRGIELLLADGRRLRAAVVSLSRSLRVDARVFAIAVPPGAALRAVLVRRAGSTLRLPASLPPAARQCGYTLELSDF